MKPKQKPPKNQPCKNPNPDSSNKNKIKNTTIDFRDIQNKINKSKPKTQKQDTLEQLLQLTSTIKSNSQIYTQFKIISIECQRLKMENQKLHEQNAYLNEEINRFKRQVSKDKKKGELMSNFSSKNGDENLREKMVSLYEEKKSLEKELEREKLKNEQGLKNIQILRQQIHKNQITLKRLNRPLKESKNNNNNNASQINTFNDMQSRFVIFSNQIIKNYEQKMNVALQDLNMKINKVQMLQKYIKEQTSRILSSGKHQNTPFSPRFNSIQRNLQSKTQQTSKLQTTYKQQQIFYPLTISPKHNQKSKSTSKIRINKFSIDGIPQYNHIIQEQVHPSASIQQSMREQQKRLEFLRQKIDLYENVIKQWQFKYNNKVNQLNKTRQSYNQLSNQLENKFLMKDKQMKNISNQLEQLKIASNKEILRINQQFNKRVYGLEANYRNQCEKKDRNIQGKQQQCKKMRQKYEFVMNQLKNCIKIINEFKNQLNSDQNLKLLYQNLDYYIELEQHQQQLILDQQKNEFEYKTKILLKDQIIFEHQTANNLHKHDIQLIRRQLNLLKEKRKAGKLDESFKFENINEIKQKCIDFWKSNIVKIENNNSKVLQRFLSIKSQNNSILTSLQRSP